jgi:hypothetical protein
MAFMVKHDQTLFIGHVDSVMAHTEQCLHKILLSGLLTYVQGRSRLAETMTEESDQQQQAPPTLRDVLAPLLDIDAHQRSFSARQLVACLGHLEETQQLLKNRKAPDVESLEDQDR